MHLFIDSVRIILYHDLSHFSLLLTSDTTHFELSFDKLRNLVAISVVKLSYMFFTLGLSYFMSYFTLMHFLKVFFNHLHYNVLLFFSSSKVWRHQEHGPVLMNLTGLN